MKYEIVRWLKGAPRPFVPATLGVFNQRPDDLFQHYRKLHATRYVYELIEYTEESWLDREWHHREVGRFSTGVYALVPWTGQPWANKHPEHFVHLSTAEPGRISFTPDAKKGRADRQTVMAPGRYLNRFYSDVLDPKEIERWAAAVTITAADFELHITQDADEIETVYRNGPSSCMSHDFDVHPARVYAGPDLGLAWLGSSSRKAVARGVVWPDKKLFGPMYGDATKLSEALKAKGYSEGGSWDGARLRKLPTGGARYAFPYLDIADGVRNDEEYFVVDDRSDEVETGSQSGQISVYEMDRCDRCGERCEDTNSVDGESWCDDCLSNTWTDAYGDYHSDDTPSAPARHISASWYNGEFYTSSTLITADAERVEIDGEFYTPESIAPCTCGASRLISHKHCHECEGMIDSISTLITGARLASADQPTLHPVAA